MTEPLMPINAATKRVYWCVRARSEQQDDREAMLNEDAWMVVLNELASLRTRLAEAEARHDNLLNAIKLYAEHQRNQSKNTDDEPLIWRFVDPDAQAFIGEE